MEHKTAFVAIVGRPNVGKSSLLNSMLGQKISIVSPKPQTTRTRITGVLTQNETQLIFIDTPGLHKPRTHLGEYMVKSVKESIVGVDICLLVVDVRNKILSSETEFINKFKKLHIPVILVINKIDLVRNKESIISLIEKYSRLFTFEAIVPLSAKTKDGVDILIKEIKKFAMPSEYYFFDSNAITDQPERVIASEIIREKILIFLDKEIPHGAAVIIEEMREREESNIMDIDAIIYCEKDNHKGIIIGKNGSMLKKIGSRARQDIENFFSIKVNLKIWVKVKKDWKNRESILKSLGYSNTNFDN